MIARELLETDVECGTLLEDKKGNKAMIILGYGINNRYVVNGKAIILLPLGIMAYNFLDEEAKIIKKVVLG